jgi:hypothetical protein
MKGGTRRKTEVGKKEKEAWEKDKEKGKAEGKKEARKEGKGREWEKARENVLLTRKVEERRRKR